MLRSAHPSSLRPQAAVFCQQASRVLVYHWLSGAATVRRSSGRALSLLLVIVLLATSTPAAPVVLTELATQWQGELGFWGYTSGWSTTMSRLLTLQGGGRGARPQERQEERDARVRRIEILPGDVTAHVEEQLVFTAVAYDRDGTPVGGVHFTWSAHDEGRGGRAMRITQRGDFEAVAPGNYKITAEGGGRQAHIHVRVRDGRGRKRNDRPSSTFDYSSRKRPQGLVSLPTPKHRGRSSAHHAVRTPQFNNAADYRHISTTKPAAMLLPGECDDVYHWNQCNRDGMEDPDNERGTPPGQSPDQGAGNGNFQLAAPVLALPGRGLDLSLGLVYNSRVWTKNGAQINFDIDQDWPAPGWSLGFGRMVNVGMDNGSMLVEPDGTRHSSLGTVNRYDYPWGHYRSFYGHTIDGSFIVYGHSGDTVNGLTSGYAYLPNGTHVQYGAPGQNALYPTRIIDANGNYITITYVNNSGPRIQTITDTLARTITFDYDPTYGLLTAITAPGLTTFPDGPPPPRVLVRLNYRQVAISPGFSGLTPMVANANPWVLNAIYYPATSTGYYFGYPDSYVNGYGMLQRVEEQRGMGFSAGAPTDPGTVTPGPMSRKDEYHFLLTNLTDAPAFDALTQSWAYMDAGAGPAVTTYETHLNDAPRKIIVTLPNGTKSTQYSYNHPPSNGDAQYDDGLIYLDETRDANGTLLQSSQTVWAQGDNDSFSAPRPLSIAVTDERGQTKGTEFSYGPVHNQVTEVRNYDYGYVYGANNTLLRNTVTQYVQAAGYDARVIYNLPQVVEVKASDGTPLSRTEYQYDGGAPNGSATLVNLPTAVVQHDDAYNPFAPQVWVPENCYCNYDESGNCIWTCDSGYWQTDYDAATDYRGNLTQVKRYADAVNLDNTTAVVETRRYDITGNMILATTACCQQTSVNYTEATQYAYPLAQTRGAASDATAQLTTSATYDFGTGLSLSATDANGRTAQTSYYPDTLRPQSVMLPTGAHTDYSYDEPGMSVMASTYLLRGVNTFVAGANVKLLNGLGQVRVEKASGAGGAWDVVETQYDALGRVAQQSRPYRLNAEPPQWSKTTYDALGRVTSEQAPDGTTPQTGSTTQVFYNEATWPGAATPNVPGQTIRVVDAWGRERWGRYDALERLVEVVEPEPNGNGGVATGGLKTSYSYDILGNLTGTTQESQTRAFQYDSLGRLTRQKLAEASATLDSNGNYVGSGGGWSDAFSYDLRSNLTARTDARGAQTEFHYDGDPLNRLHYIHYNLAGAHESLANSPIAPISTDIVYNYVPTGDVTRLESVTSGAGSESYLYEQVEQRLSRVTVAVNGRQPYLIDYTYDALDRVVNMTYPNEYGVGGAPRKVVQPSYDAASRLNGLQVGPVSYASNITYNASSQTTALNVGPANAYQTTETYDYDPQTGLLTGQKVYRGTDTPQNRLLHMSYNYLRAGTTDGRTGQLTGSTNNLDATQGKDRDYEYDALGRLKRATGGGATGSWTQRYLYDRFGNRANVLSQRTSEFITNVYHAVLNREPGSGERQPADNALRQAYAQGPAQFLDMAQTTVAGLFSTQEYTNRNRTDHEYVYDLYQAYLQREPDQGGWAGWTAAVASVGRAAVRQGFADSVEFANRVSGLYPGAGATGSAPTGLTVTTNSSAQVSLNWTAAGGTVDHYEVERRGAGGGYAWLANTPTPAFNDTAVTGSGAAYLYQVRAVFAGGATSAYSNAALGTAVSFTDEPLVAGATPIKAQHLYELRQAVNAVRRLAGLGDATWTDVALVGVVVKATHVQELRDRLNEALVALGLPAGTWTDAVLATGAQGTAIKAVHVTELRTRATRGSGTAQGGGGTPATVPVDGWNALSFDAATNRINSAGWEYDAAGNQTRALSPAGSWLRYEYDAAGRLVRVKNDANQVISTYTYGDSNQRLMTEESGQRTYYVWAGGTVIAEYTEDVTVNVPQWTKSYVYLGNRLLATLTPTGSTEAVQYHHPDRLGTRLITNGADAGYSEQTTLPFGTALDAESTGATNRRFTSYDRSSVSKLDYAVNRTYDSMQGRFTQVDPIGMSAASLSNPQSLNLYSYCGNDPVNHTDPSGLLFGGLFRAIGSIFHKLQKWLAVAVIVAVVVLAFVQPALIVPLLKSVAPLLGQGTLSGIVGPGGTAVFNPNAGSGLFTSTWRRYATYDGPIDPDEIVRVNINICRNGNQYPYCNGVGQPGFWEGLIPIWGSGRSAIDHFQNGRWVRGTIQAAIAISDVFLVKSIVTAGGKILVEGAGKLAAREAAEEGAAGVVRVASTPFGRSVEGLRAGDPAWRRVAAHIETATGRRYAGGTSIEEVFTNVATGERIIRHTIVRGDRVLHETFRTYPKYGR